MCCRSGWAEARYDGSKEEQMATVEEQMALVIRLSHLIMFSLHI